MIEPNTDEILKQWTGHASVYDIKALCDELERLRLQPPTEDEYWDQLDQRLSKERQLADDTIAAITRERNTARAQVATLREALEDLITAADRIRHWHDAMDDNSGMVVSAKSVRELWVATPTAQAALKETEGT